MASLAALLVTTQGCARASTCGSSCPGSETWSAATGAALERRKTIDTLATFHATLAIHAGQRQRAVRIVDTGCAAAGAGCHGELAVGELGCLSTAAVGAGLIFQAIPVGFALIATLTIDRTELARRALAVELAQFFVFQLAD